MRPGHRALSSLPAASVIHPRRPSRQSAWQPLPPEAAAAVINIYFAVTHTPNSSTDLCQERSQECLSHSRNASVYLWGGEGQLVKHLG